MINDFRDLSCLMNLRNTLELDRQDKLIWLGLHENRTLQALHWNRNPIDEEWHDFDKHPLDVFDVRFNYRIKQGN